MIFKLKRSVEIQKQLFHTVFKQSLLSSWSALICASVDF